MKIQTKVQSCLWAFYASLFVCLLLLPTVHEMSNKSKKFKAVKKHFGAVYVLAEPWYCLLPEWISPFAQICFGISRVCHQHKTAFTPQALTINQLPLLLFLNLAEKHRNCSSFEDGNHCRSALESAETTISIKQLLHLSRSQLSIQLVAFCNSKFQLVPFHN